MNWITSRVLWGILLIAGGIIFLLDNLGIIAIGTYFWAFLFAVGSLGFLSVFVADRQNWWALIPGIVLLAIGTIIFLGEAFPVVADQWGGSIVLGGIGLSFILVYLVNRENWWAIIPAGVMFTLAIVAGLNEALTGFDTGGIFFLGLGLTFALIAILPNPHGQMKWAFIPAGVLIFMGLLILAAFTQLINYIWPVVLILAGLYLVFRTFISRR
jgi:hypothetical protein